MKKVLDLLLVFVFMVTSMPLALAKVTKYTHVKGYYRKNGTHVSGHTRMYHKNTMSKSSSSKKRRK